MYAKNGASRVEQFRVGANETIGEVVLLLHPDTACPPDFAQTMLDALRNSTNVADSFGKPMGGSASFFIHSDSLQCLSEQPDFLRADEAEAWRRLRKLGRIVAV